MMQQGKQSSSVRTSRIGTDQARERVIDHLRVEFQHPALDIYMEAKLKESGWLALLEQAGILPEAHNPNPHDPVQEPTAHDTWWDKHPVEREMFRRDLETREMLLRHFYMGARLSNL